MKRINKQFVDIVVAGYKYPFIGVLSVLAAGSLSSKLRIKHVYFAQFIDVWTW